MTLLPPSLRRLLLWGLALLSGCITPYAPEAVSLPPSYLVVDGFINLAGVTTVKLTRTYAIGTPGAAPKEVKATAYIEREDGPRYALRESAAGIYTSDNLTLPVGTRYRLKITTNAGQSYASDFVTPKLTPAVDQVTWRPDKTGLTIFVSAHDAANATTYYRWDYEETWEIKPLLVPYLEYYNNDVRQLRVPYPIQCWSTQTSTAIYLTKTDNLSQDVVADFPLQTLPSNSSKLYQKYSILVRQYAQTKEEYAYWSQLQKNTEHIGTLFDPQPSTVTGNVHAQSDPAAVVLGYVGAGTMTEKRIFIGRAELPPSWRILTGYEKCYPPDTVLFKDRHSAFQTLYIVPVEEIKGGIKYTSTSVDCVDCRKRGTAVRPSYWQ